MTDRSPIWIGLADLLLCVISVVIVAVAPKAKAEGSKQDALYLASVEWSVNIDADVDGWLMTPLSRRPVSFGARQVGCVALDQDNKGFSDSRVTLADGRIVKAASDKETISIRCLAPGHYDHATNLYAYRIDGAGQDGRKDLGLKVHSEIVALNPTVHVLWAGDVTLDHVGQTVNDVSFDIGEDGHVTISDPPLELVTAKFLGKSEP